MLAGLPLRAVVLAVVVTPLGIPVPVVAQSPGQAARPEPQATAAPPAGGSARVDASLARIRRMLRETPPSRPPGSASLLELQYHVDVIGTLPRLDIFKGFDMGRTTPVQYGGMTHAEFLQVTAPPWRRR